jgi:Protein of unknown function (DUF2865)
MRLHPLLPAATAAALAAAGLALVMHDPRHTAAGEATPAQSAPISQLGPQQGMPEAQPATVGEMRVAQGWLRDLFGNGPPRGAPEPRPRPEELWPRQGSEDLRLQLSGPYRALCVRLCDGFPYPISNATTRDRFPANARQCEQSCPGRSRLFVVRSAVEGPDDAVDLQGQPYRKLDTAFRYRTEYDASCTCRGNPWDEAALARHRAYAEAEKAGRKVAPVAERPAKARDASRRDGRGGRASRTARSDWQRDDGY